jgi:predicted secreted Zn-dependent protease
MSSMAAAVAQRSAHGVWQTLPANVARHRQRGMASAERGVRKISAALVVGLKADNGVNNGGAASARHGAAQNAQRATARASRIVAAASRSISGGMANGIEENGKASA